MRTRVKTNTLIVVGFLCIALGASALHAASLTSYEDEYSFNSSAGFDLTYEDFEGWDVGTIMTDQISGVVFSSPNGAQPNYLPIQIALSGSSTSSPDNSLFGGLVPVLTEPGQTIVMNFPRPPTAFAFFLVAQAADATDVSVVFDFVDGTSQTLFAGDTDGNESTPEFFGVTSDTPISRVTLNSGFVPEETFEEFAIDDLQFGNFPPECNAVPYSFQGIPGVEGSATDDDGFETVFLDEGSTNLEIVDSGSDGLQYVYFRVEQIDPALDGIGTVVVMNLDGLTCTVPVSLVVIPPGAVDNEVLCDGDGVLVGATNPNQPGGVSTCTVTELIPEETPLPPGYKPSPPDDPYPCTLQQIESPISGLTDVVLKKDGEFEPRLRLLFARSPDGGITFDPLQDFTELVDQITTITPDPTRASGKKLAWSTVRVTCAVLAEICDGVDNDGNGEIDEGLPVDGAPVDIDMDGFPLCPTAGQATIDCNDQRDFIYPGAPELCNGMDDDCDGTIDDNATGAGESCTIPGLLGACADGVTSCEGGPLVCVGPDPVPEICDNGIDDDCNGLTDRDDPACDPLLVVLESFTGEVERMGVRLHWTTSSEMDNVGFLVLRAREGEEPELLTVRLIPAQGSELTGATYEYFDATARRPGMYHYFLEDVDTNGARTRHLPVSVELQPGRQGRRLGATRGNHGRPER
jgi:hypothetical protein